MMPCPAFVIKSPPPAAPPHCIYGSYFYKVHIFFSSFFSEIQNVDVLYFLWPVAQWEKKKRMLKVCRRLLCNIFCDKGKEEGVKSFCVAMGNTLSV